MDSLYIYAEFSETLLLVNALHVSAKNFCSGIHMKALFIMTVKSLLEAYALIEAHSPVWTPKMLIFFKQISTKKQASNKGPPTNIKKNRSCAMQKHLEFVISSEFLVVHLQQIVVECLTRDRGAGGLSLTGFTALWSLSKTHLS